jgi:hypothetical protein
MNINSIEFNTFIEEFYNNYSGNKMLITIDIENDEPNIYDLHIMLLELLIQGFIKFNHVIDDNLDIIIDNLQSFFTNINIKLNIINYSKIDLICDNSPYINRYIKMSDIDNMIINGGHLTVNNLELIKSFFLINNEYNLCISFNFII